MSIDSRAISSLEQPYLLRKPKVARVRRPNKPILPRANGFLKKLVPDFLKRDAKANDLEVRPPLQAPTPKPSLEIFPSPRATPMEQAPPEPIPDRNT